eukprot:4194273-Pyramimonas_sp.AAC.1
MKSLNATSSFSLLTDLTVALNSSLYGLTQIWQDCFCPELHFPARRRLAQSSASSSAGSRKASASSGPHVAASTASSAMAGLQEVDRLRRDDARAEVSAAVLLNLVGRNSEADSFGRCGFVDPGLSDPHGPMDVAAPKDGDDDAVEQEL